MPEYSERFFRSGTLRIHFRDWGNSDAPPLILVHGLRDHSHSFDDLFLCFWLVRRASLVANPRS